MFIVFEGIDGSGKSTQVRALLRRLRRSGRPVLSTREPGGTPLGESVRRWVKTQPNLSPLDELFLFSAARAHLVERVIRPALAEGKVVVTDRFVASTVAYQGHGRGLDLEFVEEVNLKAVRGLAPDLTVLLDVDPGAASLRLSGAPPNTTDNFDAAPADFHRRVRQGYLDQAESDPSRWLVLDASLSKRRLSGEIWAKVEPLL